MPFQNRVDPWGQLHAVPARGTLLGNRGIIHNAAQHIVAPWRTKAWITCRLEWRGWRRSIMQPRSWTELFFLDEATAFAAGHRPCAYCRRARFAAFKTTWLAVNPDVFSAAPPRIIEIDKVLHKERTRKGGGKVTYEEKLSALPDGAMVELGAGAYLLWNRQVLQWSFAGYTVSEIPRFSLQRVRVLTPASIVRMFRSGFRPDVHANVQLQ
jgi:hypothetical protein